jgi:hypothetical protein
MSQPYASGRHSVGICDRCARKYPLTELKWQWINLRNSNLLVCPDCLDVDHPQYQLGRFPIYDPQALENPRPDQKNDAALVVPQNYYVLPGGVGSYASTPNAAPVQITGDISLLAYVALTTWTPPVNNPLITKNLVTGNKRGYQFTNETLGRLHFSASISGVANTVLVVSTVTVPVSGGSGIWVMATFDADNGAGGNTVNFYYSNDAPTTDPSGVTWSALGLPVTTAGVMSIFNSSADLNIGANNAGLTTADGKIYRAQVYNGIFGSGGFLVADFNPDDGIPGDNSFVSSTTGETYTINGSSYIASSSYDGLLAHLEQVQP